MNFNFEANGRLRLGDRKPRKELVESESSSFDTEITPEITNQKYIRRIFACVHKYSGLK